MKESKSDGDWLKDKGLPIMPEYKYVWIKSTGREWRKERNPYYQNETQKQT